MNFEKKLFIVSVVTLAIIAIIGCNCIFAKSNSLIPKTLLFGNPEQMSPLISPDGSKLAYCAQLNGVMNVWIKTPGKNDAVSLTNDSNRGISGYYWAKNGRQIYYFQDQNGNENAHLFCIDIATKKVRDLTPFENTKAQLIESSYFSPDEILISLNKRDSKLFDAYSLNTRSGELKLIAQNPGNIEQWFSDYFLQIRAAIAINPDGSQTLMVRKDKNSPWHSLLQVDFEDTLRDELYCGVLGFSRDGNYLYLNSSIGNDTRCLQQINLNTYERTIIASDLTYDIAYVYFDLNTYEPKVVSWNKDRFDYKVIKSAFEQDFKNMRAISKGDLYDIQHSADGSKYVLGFAHDNQSFEYYLYDAHSKQSTFLFYARPKLNNYKLASMKPISFTSRDGLKIEGYLTCPVDKNKNVPLVLYVHGGPFARDNWGYSPVAQWLANRGCACLQVNFRGSTGYGKKFLAAGNGEWGAKMQNDLTDAVQWAIDQGIADPNKVAIFGGSYGGYATLVGATMTPDLYCCAIAFVAVSNLITFLKTMPPYWRLSQWEKRVGKREEVEFLKSRSPLFHIDKLKIPVLIAHGANDIRVKQSESEQIVDAMKKKGIDYEYVLFPDEGHGFVKPQNRLKFYDHAEKFLAKNLGTQSEN